MAWQQNPDRKQDPNNLSAADIMRNCLLAAGITAPPAASNKELSVLLLDHGIELSSCITK
jgi:hypothetical protein